jgi:hypothetical protein
MYNKNVYQHHLSIVAFYKGCMDEQGHCRNESEIWSVSTGVTCYQKRCVRTDTGTKVKFEIKLDYRGNISIYNYKHNNKLLLLLLVTRSMSAILLIPFDIPVPKYCSCITQVAFPCNLYVCAVFLY